MALLKLQNVEKYYGNKSSLTKAVDDISFTVDKGEFTAIMGASGSGKTTLLNCISTIDRVTAGHIFLEDTDITQLKGKALNRFRREKLGFIFQDFNLMDTLTAYENIALALSIQKRSAKDIDKLVKSVAEQLGMDKHEGFSMVAGLSGDVDANSTAYYNQIDIYTVSGQMDFAFTDEAGVQYLCDLGTPLDVTKQLPDNLLDLWANREATFSQRNENDDTYFDNYAAIDISGTKVQEYFGLDDNMCYLVIVDLSGNEEYMQNFYNLLYEIEIGE